MHCRACVPDLSITDKCLLNYCVPFDRGWYTREAERIEDTSLTTPPRFGKNRYACDDVQISS